MFVWNIILVIPLIDLLIDSTIKISYISKIDFFRLCWNDIIGLLSNFCEPFVSLCFLFFFDCSRRCI